MDFRSHCSLNVIWAENDELAWSSRWSWKFNCQFDDEFLRSKISTYVNLDLGVPEKKSDLGDGYEFCFKKLRKTSGVYN